MTNVVWAPQPGSQQRFLSCPYFECLLHGQRGGGKTDALLMAFAQHIGRGYGTDWNGYLFRQTYPQLQDVVSKSERWFRKIFPQARFNQQKLRWTWPDGETLTFAHMRVPSDYWSYHGHNISAVMWEELTNWPDDRCYKMMFSCVRSTNPDVPLMVRSTTNAYGIGSNWIKDRFRLAGNWGKTILIEDSFGPDGETEPPRCAIFSSLDENKLLLAANPNYKQTIAAAATNPAMAAAWLEGSWDIVSGGMFNDVWSDENSVKRFIVPDSWQLDRAFDWGSSAPFSVGWWARSDGTDLVFIDGTRMRTVRGDLFRVAEWYGWTGRANEGLRMLAVDIARGIVERERLWGWYGRVRPGPADSSIFTVENGRSIAVDMEQPIRIDGTMYQGISWEPADKRPGSRKAGWEQVRTMIRDAHRPEDAGSRREKPGLFVVADACPQFLRTILSLPRDDKDLDDVDTDSEDHIADEVRYRVRSIGNVMKFGKTVGGY